MPKFLFAALAAALLMAGPVAARDLSKFAPNDGAAGSTADAARDVDHSAWGAFLKKYVRTGAPDGVNRVAYGAVTAADRATLEAYIAQLQRLDPTRLSRDAAFAYWANLYNAITVDLVVENWPVKSIKDIRSGFLPGPWKRDIATVDGETLSLDDIEHGILRAYFGDNRVHYAVNCASFGCPNLAPEPFTAKRLDAQLDAAARAYINNPRGAHFDDDGRLVVSSIYNWFKEDFGGTDAGVLTHLKRYADPALSAKLANVTKIDGYAYNWNVNAADGATR